MKFSIAGLALAATLLGFSCGGLIDGNGETGYRDIGTSGGDVRAKDTVVSVPEGAVDHTERLTITPAPAEELPQGSAGPAVDLGPDGMQFTTPVKVQLAFDPAALPDPSRPDLVWIGTVVEGEWEPLADTEVDLEHNTVSGTTLHFSRYGVVHGCGEGRRCATRISISTPQQRVAQGACSGRVGIRLLDEHERLAPVQHDTGLVLASSRAGVTFYSDEACQHETHELPMARGTSETRFFFKGSSAGAFVVTVSARDLRPASQEDAILAPASNHLTFTSARQNLGLGVCSAAATVELQNGSNEPVAAPAELSLALSTVGSVTVAFFSDAACSVESSHVAIPAGASHASFYFRVSQAAQATFVLVATSGELIARQEAGTTPAAAAGLRFHSLAQTVASGRCSGLTLVGAVDSAGNRTYVPSATTVSLTTSGTLLQTYSDSSCTTAISSVTLQTNELSAGFYFKASAAGSYTIAATADGLSSASQTETITSVTPMALGFTVSARRVPVGTCSAEPSVIATIDSTGAYAPVADSTTVALSSDSATISFYADAACSVAVTSVTIAAGQSRAAFYVRDTAIETINISAAASGLGAATQSNSFFN